MSKISPEYLQGCFAGSSIQSLMLLVEFQQFCLYYMISRLKQNCPLWYYSSCSNTVIPPATTDQWHSSAASC